MRAAVFTLAVAVVASVNAVAAADEIRVPRDHRTLQAAIDAAAPGDTIVVRGGRNHRDVVIPASKPGLQIFGTRARARSIAVLADGVFLTGFRVAKGSVRLAGRRTFAAKLDVRAPKGEGATVFLDGDDAVLESSRLRGGGVAGAADGLRVTQNTLDAASVSLAGASASVAGNAVWRGTIEVRGDEASVDANIVTGSERPVLVVGDGFDVANNFVLTDQGAARPTVPGLADAPAAIEARGDAGVVESNDVDAHGDGIVVRGDGVRVVGNGVLEAGSRGIVVEGGSGVEVAWNALADAVACGIHFEPPCIGAVCDANRVLNCTTGLLNEAQGTTVTSSFFAGNVRTDICNMGTFALFADNVFRADPEDENLADPGLSD